MPADFDRRIAAIALVQHSLIRLVDVLGAGGTRSCVRQRVARGVWEFVAPGVYRIAGVPWTYEAEVLAAIFAAGDGAVASHRCAARLRGIGFRRAPVEISIPRGRHHRPSGVQVHTSTDLSLDTISTVDGIPTTSAARTLLDLARYVRGLALTKAVEQARRAGLVTWQDLVAVLARHARQGRHGITRLREVTATGLRRDGLTDTDAELIAYVLLKEHGFDSFVLHHELRATDGELVADLDLADVEQRIDLELDGSVHRDMEVVRRDARRDSRVRKMGWIVERVPNEVAVFEPNEFLRIVRQAIKDAAARDG